MATNFNAYSEYYDLLYQDKDYASEARYVSDHIKRLLPGAVRVLELGCGTGNHARYLCRMGYEVTGIERSAGMLELAASKQIQNFTPLLADITDFKSDLRYDAAVCLFHSLCYLTTNDALLACFKNVWRHLQPGGVFAFDLWYAPAVIHNLPSARIKRRENDQVEIVRLAETQMLVNKNMAEVNYEIIIKNKSNGRYNTLKEQHPMRYFSIPEIEMLAVQTGFTCVLAREFMGTGEPTINSWNILMLLQKEIDA